MARLILSSGESATISSGNFDVFGTSSGEEITLLSGSGNYVFDASFNKGGDQIALWGDAADWSIQRQGSRAILTNGSANIYLPVGVAGILLAFDNAELQLRWDTQANAMMLGSVEVGSSRQTLDIGEDYALFFLPETVYVDEGDSGILAPALTGNTQNVSWSLINSSEYELNIDSENGSVWFDNAPEFVNGNNTFDITVKAVSQSGLITTADAHIIISDTSSTDEIFTTDYVDVEQVGVGYFTGYVPSIFNGDSREFITYSIDPQSPLASYFEIDNINGHLFTTKTISEIKNIEGIQSLFITINVLATDQDGNTDSQEVRISEYSGNISNDSDFVLNIPNIISISENVMPVGLFASDFASRSGQFKFSIGGPDADLFWIHSATGELFFKNGGADFEAFGSAARSNDYSLIILAHEDGELIAEKNLIIRVLNETTEYNPREGDADFIRDTDDGGLVIYGRGGDDLIVGTDRFDDLTGGLQGGDDYLIGLGGDDWLRGDSGNDILEGGAGNDRLMGNGGTDVALYQYSTNDAVVTREGVTWSVAVPDGIDQLPYADMEILRFSNAEISLSPDGRVTDPFNYDAEMGIFGDNGGNTLSVGSGSSFVDGKGGVDVVEISSWGNLRTTMIGDGYFLLEDPDSPENKATIYNVEAIKFRDDIFTLEDSLALEEEFGYLVDQGIYDDRGDTFLITNIYNTVRIRTTQIDSGSGYVLVDQYKLSAEISDWVLPSDYKPIPYWIDALLPNGAAGFSERLGGTVLFGFPDDKPSYLVNTEAAGFNPFNDSQRTYARELLDRISQVVDLEFIEVEDVAQRKTLAFYNVDNPNPYLGGYAFYPDWAASLNLPFYDLDNVVNSNSVEPSLTAHLDPSDENFGGVSLIHEIGHSLGLKHPFASEGDEPGYLPESEAIKLYTVMAYDGLYEGGDAARLHVLDIAALHYLYGPNPDARSGDDTYTISLSDPNFIWDGNGHDTIDLSDLPTGANVSLEPGDHGFVQGLESEFITSPGSITVNFGTIIEDIIGSDFSDMLKGNEFSNLLIGGGGDDWLIGDAGDDRLEGGAGNDSLFGGAGVDVAVFTGNRDDYEVTFDKGSVIIASENEGRDVLLDIEQFQFLDGTYIISNSSLALIS